MHSPVKLPWTGYISKRPKGETGHRQQFFERASWRRPEMYNRQNSTTWHEHEPGSGHLHRRTAESFGRCCRPAKRAGADVFCILQFQMHASHARCIPEDGAYKEVSVWAERRQ